MSRLFIDIGSSSLFKSGQKIGGDVFLLSRNPDKSQIVCTLSDGLGSGVKANVLASLTARMAHKLSFSPMHLVNSATIIMNTLPVCKERKISYSTFTIADIRLQEEQGVVLNLVEYDNPRALVFVQGQSKQWEPQTKNLHRQGAFKEEVILHSTLTMEQGDRLILFSDGVSQAGLGTQKNLGWRRAGGRIFCAAKNTSQPRYWQ
ncbi:MAG: SpoIIE family protein phosphatase [Sphaerochaetaceae bacterium]